MEKVICYFLSQEREATLASGRDEIPSLHPGFAGFHAEAEDKDHARKVSVSARQSASPE